MSKIKLYGAAALLAVSMAASAGAEAAKLTEWTYASGVFYIDTIEQPKNIMLTVEATWNLTSHAFFTMIPGKWNNCEPDSQMVGDEMAPMKINDRYFKAKYACAGGSRMIIPATKIGQKYLDDLAYSGKAFTFSFRSDVTMHYPASNIKGMLARKKELQQAQ
ncbi:hypothetical protein [Kosakonia sp. 1610]|uniref:hypothetical protein n=1 Tax=Kosakonia sp. 1610 TaxID=3156426 RepID=UPI003D1909AD